MTRFALLSLLALSCASHAQSPVVLADYLDRLTAYEAAQAHELPHSPILTRIQAIDAIASRPNPYSVDLVKGRAVYETRCAPCHGSHGEGATVAVRAYGNVTTGPPLDRPDVRDEFSVGTIAYVAGGTWGSMTQLGEMSDEERWAVAEYVKRGTWWLDNVAARWYHVGSVEGGRY